MHKSLYRKGDRFYAPGFEVYVDRRQVGGSVDVHWHDYCEVEMVISGRGVHEINNQRYTLAENCVYLVTPLDFHNVCPEGEMEIFHVQFGCSVLGSEMMQRITRTRETREEGIAARTDGRLAEKLRALFEEMEEEFSARREDSVSMLRCCLERLCILILREAEKGEKPGRHSARGQENTVMNRAIQYVQYNFRNPITLSQTARQVHLSDNYFGELFRNRMGMSFNRYLRGQRMAYAVRLLEETELNIAEVVRESGFRSAAYFAEIFKKEYGETPTQFRCARRAERKKV